jgi:hypothetical protein
MQDMQDKQATATDKQIWPYMLSVAGPFLLAAGFLYDLFLAGIPYQDPTPEMTASYDRHSAIATVIYCCGALVLLAGITAVMVRFLFRRRR